MRWERLPGGGVQLTSDAPLKRRLLIAGPVVLLLGGLSAAGFAYSADSWREGLKLFGLFVLLDTVIIFGSLGMRALARRRARNRLDNRAL